MSKISVAGSKLAIKAKAFVDALNLQAEKLYIRNWEFTWSLPSVINNCENSTFCVTQDNSPQLNGFEANANTFFELQRKAVKKLKKVTRKRRSGKRFLKRARELLKKTDSLLKTIPTTADDCS